MQIISVHSSERIIKFGQ